MLQADRRHRWLYIVRIWLEPVSDGPPALRGSVRDVDGGPPVYFATLRDLSDYIQLRSRSDGTDADAAGGSDTGR